MSEFYTATQAKADYQKALEATAAKDAVEVNRILIAIKRAVDNGQTHYSMDCALRDGVIRLLRAAGYTVTYESYRNEPNTKISGWA